MNKMIDTLAETIGVENLEILAGMCSRIKERAVERQCEQEVYVFFNKIGDVRFIKGSDNINGVKMKTYKSE